MSSPESNSPDLSPKEQEMLRTWTESQQSRGFEVRFDKDKIEVTNQAGESIRKLTITELRSWLFGAISTEEA